MVPNATTVQEKITKAFITAPFPADGYDIYAAQTDDDYGNPIFTTEHLPEILVWAVVKPPTNLSKIRSNQLKELIPRPLRLERPGVRRGCRVRCLSR